MVEHRLAKARVAGSSPVSPLQVATLSSCPPKDAAGSTEKGRNGLKVAFAGLVCAPPGVSSVKMARYPSGKGEVFKTFMRRFDSDPRLQFLSITYDELKSAGCQYGCQ